MFHGMHLVLPATFLPRDVPSTTFTVAPEFPTGDPLDSSDDSPPTPTAPYAKPINLPTVTPEQKVKQLLTGALRNARNRNRAKECQNFSEETFVNETLTFLNYWKTEDYYVPREGAPKTEKDLLERLVEYQIVRDTVQEQGRMDAFPEAIVDQIRGAHEIVSKEGVLTSAQPRVLNALDTIFNDICTKSTNNTQIPFRLQEIVDVVLRGLAVNPQLATPQALVQRPACDCRGIVYMALSVLL
ncbi:hypothetical protein PG991_014388 [Apiospora marii]|uniref:Uncharacterized protein n=1 Tax=Apiospora marii TaxID=335849 RepID=A0ABR1R8L3_9PEZI